MYLSKEMKVDGTLRTGETAGAVLHPIVKQTPARAAVCASLHDVDELCSSSTCSLIQVSVSWLRKDGCCCFKLLHMPIAKVHHVCL